MSETKYPVKMERRPWVLSEEAYKKLESLVSTWLKERGGIVVYENPAFDSSHFGDQSFLPARFIAQEDNQMHDAPPWHEGGTGCCSRREHAVDFITLEQYGGDAAKAWAEAFKMEEVQAKCVRRVQDSHNIEWTIFRQKTCLLLPPEFKMGRTWFVSLNGKSLVLGLHYILLNKKGHIALSLREGQFKKGDKVIVRQEA